MKTFLWNLALAMVWTTATGWFSLTNVAIGLILGYIVLYVAQPVTGRSAYFAKVVKVFGFAGYFLWQVVKANLQVAHDVVTPTFHMRPGVIAISLDARTDAEILILSSLITLTPGSLSLDISPDRKTLYVHAMFLEDADAVRWKIKDGFERRILELLR